MRKGVFADGRVRFFLVCNCSNASATLILTTVDFEGTGTTSDPYR